MPREDAGDRISITPFGVPYGKPGKFSVYIAGSDYTNKLMNFRYRKRLNQMSTFEGDLIGVKSNDSAVSEGNEVMFFTGSHLDLKGKLDKPKWESFGKAKIQGKGMERDLHRRHVNREEWVSSGTDEIVRNLCSENLDGSSPWVMETGTVHNWGTIGQVRGEYSNRLRILSELAHVSTSGTKSYDWYVSQSGTNFSTDKFNFVKHRGSQSSVKTFTTGDNAYMVAYEKDMEELANDITVLGYGDGANQISGTASDATSKANYGTHEKSFYDRTLIDSSVAGSLAQAYVNELKDPIERIRLQAVDDNTTDVEVGDYVTVEDDDVFPGGSDFRVVGIEKSRNRGRRKLIYELSNKSKAFAENVSDTKKDLDAVGTYAKGSTDSFQISSYENCDDATSLNMRFYLPTDVIRILKGNLAFKMKDYRAYSQANSDVNTSPSQDTSKKQATTLDWDGTPGWMDLGSWKVADHTFGVLTTFSLVNTYHSSLTSPQGIRISGTDGIFPDSSYAYVRPDFDNAPTDGGYGGAVFATGDFSGNYIVAQFNPSVISSSTGSLSASVTFQSINTHTHGVDFDIYEETLTSPEVTVEVGEEGSESTVGTYDTDQDAVDITSYIQGAGSWTNIKFTPNKRMRIEANAYIKEFIESK